MNGSCLCGAVRYEITGPFLYASNCHCTQCRKAHGAAYGSYGVLRAEHFRYLAGEDAVAHYRSSDAATRAFCQHCGSTLEWRGTAHPERLGITLGTLDEDPGVRPERHIFVASKAPWVTIADGLPQFAAHAAPARA